MHTVTKLKFGFLRQNPNRRAINQDTKIELTEGKDKHQSNPEESLKIKSQWCHYYTQN